MCGKIGHQDKFYPSRFDVLFLSNSQDWGTWLRANARQLTSAHNPFLHDKDGAMMPGNEKNGPFRIKIEYNA